MISTFLFLCRIPPYSCLCTSVDIFMYFQKKIKLVGLCFSFLVSQTICIFMWWKLPLFSATVLPRSFIHHALHWQVCSQCDARFCCAMLCNVKSPAGGQQSSFMLHYSDSGFLFHPFLHFSTISKAPIWMPLKTFLNSISFKLISALCPSCLPLYCTNSTVLSISVSPVCLSTYLETLLCHQIKALFLSYVCEDSQSSKLLSVGSGIAWYGHCSYRSWNWWAGMCVVRTCVWFVVEVKWEIVLLGMSAVSILLLTGGDREGSRELEREKERGRWVEMRELWGVAVI